MKTRILLTVFAIGLMPVTTMGAGLIEISALGFNLVTPPSEDETSDEADEPVIHKPSKFEEKQIKKGKSTRPASPLGTLADTLTKKSKPVEEKGALKKTSLLVNTPPPSRIQRKKTGSVFQAFPKDTPDLMARSIKFELTDAQELIPELAYSFKFENFLTGISYNSVKYSTAGSIQGVPDALVGRNRTQRQLKLYPLSWAFKLYNIHYAVGTFYSRLEMERTEFGVMSVGSDTQNTINFNNEVLLNAEQLGIQSAFLYSNKLISVRGSIDLSPLSRLTVNESSLFRIGDQTQNKTTPEGDAGFSFNTKVDFLLKTPYYIDFNLSASYDRMPVSYQQTTTEYQQNINTIIFSAEPFNSTTSTLGLGIGLMLSMPSAIEFSPMIEAKMIEQSISYGKDDPALVVRNYIASIGFSRRF
ncbi:MAG: hypothetical protein OEX19_00740 [Gammaproteobacteria bacterium]|nr:hypothetical protein [Gammaproteobacteria bacterium]